MKPTATLLAAIALLLGAAPTADAAGYIVYSCKQPNGLPAPADGWSITGSPPPYSYFANGCPSGGAIGAALGGPSQLSGASHVGWRFESGGAAIAGYRIYRSATVTASGVGTTGLFYTADKVNDPAGGSGVDYCATFAGCRKVGDHPGGVSAANRLERAGLQIPTGSTQWFATIACAGYVGYACTAERGATELASLRIHAAQFTLIDDDSPTAGSPTGSLTADFDPAAGGTISFHAEDALSGVYRAGIELDGEEVVSLTPNDYGGRCVKLSLAGTVNDFLYRAPCPRRQQVELALPPTALAPGSHALRVRVKDAAGNAVTAFGPRTFTVAGPAPPLWAEAAPPPAPPARLRVARRVQLRALHRRVRPLGRMILVGRVRTARLRRGVLVEIQLRGRRRWRTVAIRRTNTTGAFRFRYRFRRTERARLAFRARARSNPDLAVTPLPSRTVVIRVG